MKKGLFFALLFVIGWSDSYSQLNIVSNSVFGRIFDMVYDQNVQNRIYAASQNNHILVSNDNGVNWEVLYSLPSGIIDELRLVNNSHLSFFLTAAADPNDVTIHILELSTLTLTTINRPLNSSSNIRTIQDYSIYESNLDIMLYKELYSIGFDNYNRVHYTTNGGQTWTMVYDEIANNLISVDKVLISYYNPDVLFISRGYGGNGVNGGLLVSNDAGANWTEYFAGTNIRAVAVDPFDTNHWMIGSDALAGQNEEVLETYDAGLNWSQVQINFDNYPTKAINEIIFHPTIQDKIIILEVNEIAITNDGANWSVQVFDPFVPGYFFGISASFNPYNSNEVMYTSNWYPFRSTDGGITLQQVFNKFSLTSFTSLSPQLGGGQDRYLYYGLQQGIFSKNLATNNETNYGVISIDQAVGFYPPLFVVDPHQYGRIFSSTEDFNGKYLSVSNDHGQSFQTFYTGFGNLVLHMAPDPIATTEVWVGFEGFLADETYIIDVTSADPWNPTISQVTMPTIQYHNSTWINPNDNQEVLVGLGGELWSTGDRGVNWTNSSSGLTMDIIGGKINRIIQSPYDTNEFILATSNGIWKSTDRYGTWSNLLMQNNAQQVNYDPNNPSVIVAATYESANSISAIYYSKDFGSTWTMIPSEDLFFSSSIGIGFDFLDDGTGFIAYVSTFDLGVITYNVLYDPLGIEKSSNEFSGISIYPNPITDQMRVVFEDGSFPRTTIIYNTLGEEVARFANQSNFELSHLKAGVYHVKMRTQNGNVIVRSIVKN